MTVARVLVATLIFGGLPHRLEVQPAARSLPLPAMSIVRMPQLPATAITARGQRLLLSQANVHVRYDSRNNSLSVDRSGWWVINYPLTKIAGLEGRSADEISRM